MFLLLIKVRTYAVTLMASVCGGYATLQGIGHQDDGFALISKWATAGFSLAASLCLIGLVFKVFHDLLGEDARGRRASRKDPRRKALEAGRSLIKKTLVESPHIDDETYRSTLAALVQLCGQSEVEGALQAMRGEPDGERPRERLRNLDDQFLKRLLFHMVTPSAAQSEPRQ